MAAPIEVIVDGVKYKSINYASKKLGIDENTIIRRSLSEKYFNYSLVQYEIPLDKKCNICGNTKSLAEFCKNAKRRDGRTSYCRACKNVFSSNWNNKNKDKVKHYNLKYIYGISIEEYNAIFNSQEGKCAICGIHQSALTKPLFVDHCHNTSDVRGLLCGNCNFGLGNFKDSIDNLSNAIKYINKTSKL